MMAEGEDGAPPLLDRLLYNLSVGGPNANVDDALGKRPSTTSRVSTGSLAGRSRQGGTGDTFRAPAAAARDTWSSKNRSSSAIQEQLRWDSGNEVAVAPLQLKGLKSGGRAAAAERAHSSRSVQKHLAWGADSSLAGAGDDDEDGDDSVQIGYCAPPRSTPRKKKALGAQATRNKDYRPPDLYRGGEDEFKPRRRGKRPETSESSALFPTPSSHKAAADDDDSSLPRTGKKPVKQPSRDSASLIITGGEAPSTDTATPTRQRQQQQGRRGSSRPADSDLQPWAKVDRDAASLEKAQRRRRTIPQHVKEADEQGVYRSHSNDIQAFVPPPYAAGKK